MNGNLITITGARHYFGSNIFQVGRYVRLRKERGNSYDADAISVDIPMIGKVGYVANTLGTRFEGTLSASVIAKRISNECTARIRLIANDGVVAEIIDEKPEAPQRLVEIDSLAKKKRRVKRSRKVKQTA